MQNVIFSTASDSFIVSHILHAGPVTEYTEQQRKGDNTHYFKITTRRGAAFCHFKNEETARRSRGVLGAMLGTVKPHLFRSKGDLLDVAAIVSFGSPVKLKNSNNEGDKFGFPVHLAIVSGKNDTVWLTFQTEESAKNVRKALYAALMSFYGESGKVDEHATAETIEAQHADQEQPEVLYADA